MARRTREPILPLDKWIASSLRRTTIALLVGLVILTTGILWWRYLDHRTAERVAHGNAIEAQVTKVRWEKVATIARAQRVAVRYSVDGDTREASLMAVFEDGNYRAGDQITVYVDQSNRSKIATADGFASEDWAMRIPTYVSAAGTVVVLVVVVARTIHLLRQSRQRD